MPKHFRLRSVCSVVLANVLACTSTYASDLVFMNGFGNVSVTIFVPTDGIQIGGALPLFSGAASVPATLDWTDSVTGYMGSGEEIIPSSLALGFQRIYLKATTAGGDYALAESDITVVIAP